MTFASFHWDGKIPVRREVQKIRNNGLAIEAAQFLSRRGWISSGPGLESVLSSERHLKTSFSEKKGEKLKSSCGS